MSYLDTLRQRRKTPISAWHKLRTSVPTGKFDFYAVFEGEEDEEFYSKFLSDRFPEKKYRPLICDGKGGVLALHAEVMAQYGSPRNIFFFVDSDHDRFIGEDDYPPQTFSTCGYSIENYLYSSAVVLSGIKKYFNVNSMDDLYGDIHEAFERDRRIFEARSMSVMAYVVALRINDQDPDLENMSLRSILTVADNGITLKKRDCAKLLDDAKVTPLPMADVIRAAKSLKGASPQIYFRGKLVAQFVLNFCRGLNRRFEHKMKLNGKPLKARIDFSKSNLVGVFADFVENPERLADFFDEMDAAIWGMD